MNENERARTAWEKFVEWVEDMRPPLHLQG